MSGNLKLESKDIAGHADIKLIKFTGDLDVVNASSLSKFIDSCIAKGCINLIFDLSNLRFIDSIGNLSLINCHIKTKRKGGGIKVFGVNESIKETLELIGVSKIIPIYESYEKALLSFQE